MAYLRLGNIKANYGSGGLAKGLSRCIDYIMNPVKTNNQQYIGGYNIFVPDSEKERSVFNTMISTKKQFSKEDGRQGYHFKLSFAAGDNVTPEQAMELTNQFCEACFKDYECVYAVHNNTAHLHSHIVINSIDMVEGMKYHYKKGDWAKVIQPRVNEICKQNNLSEIDLSMDENFILKHKCKCYSQWKMKEYNKNKGIFYSNKMIKSDVDECIQFSHDYEEFKLLMEKKGHVVQDTGKHIKVLAPGRERFCRLYSLTPDKQTYTKENIIKMIEGTYVSREEVQSRLISEWNSYTVVNVKVAKVKFSVEFAKHLEESRMISENGFTSSQDAARYLDYLIQADKELNIIRKKVQSSMAERKNVLDKMDELMSLMRYYVRHNKGDERFWAEHDRVDILYKEIAGAGYHLGELYRYKATGEMLVDNINQYKKHIYVQTKVCERIINEKNKDVQVSEVRQVHQVQQVRK